MPSPRPTRSSSLRADIEATEAPSSGEYDEEALVTIRSSAGGDAADRAEVLMWMYIRWAEQRRNTPVEVR